MKSFWYRLIALASFCMLLSAIIWFFIINQKMIDDYSVPSSGNSQVPGISIQKMALNFNDAMVFTDTVLLHQVTKDIDFLGNTKVLWNKIEFCGTGFRYQHNNNFIITDKPISMCMPRLMTTASSMSIDIKNKKITMSGDVCTVFNKSSE